MGKAKKSKIALPHDSSALDRLLKDAKVEVLEKAAEETRSFCGDLGWDDGYLSELESRFRRIAQELMVSEPTPKP